MIGQFVLYVGPMFAGKTEHLIKDVLWQTYLYQLTLRLTHAGD